MRKVCSICRSRATEGKISVVLHGRKGDTDGAILSDGSVLRLPPKAGAKNLGPGRSVKAEGRSRSAPMAKVIEVRKLIQRPAAVETCAGFGRTDDKLRRPAACGPEPPAAGAHGG